MFCFQQKSPALSTFPLRNDWKQQKQTASWSRCTSLPSEYWWQLSSLLVYKFTITIGDHLMCFGLLSQRSQRSHDTICIQHPRHNKGGRRGDCCQTLWPQRSVFVSPGFKHGVVLFFIFVKKMLSGVIDATQQPMACSLLALHVQTALDRFEPRLSLQASQGEDWDCCQSIKSYHIQTCSAKWLQLGVGIESSCREQWFVSLLATDPANRSIYATISWADV